VNIGNLLQENPDSFNQTRVYRKCDPEASNYAFTICGAYLKVVISYDSNIITGGFGAYILGQGLL
jgi:hypothetical protein